MNKLMLLLSTLAFSVYTIHTMQRSITILKGKQYVRVSPDIQSAQHIKTLEQIDESFNEYFLEISLDNKFPILFLPVESVQEKDYRKKDLKDCIELYRLTYGKKFQIKAYKAIYNDQNAEIFE